MSPAEDKFTSSGLYAQIDTIKDTVKRFDEAMLTAAGAAVPHGIDRLPSILTQMLITIPNARPELVKVLLFPGSMAWFRQHGLA